MTQRRYFAIDHLRTGMMFVVMFGHPLLPYVTVPRSFKDPFTHVGFDVMAIFLYAFAMQAFFVTAGFAAALVFERKGTRALWRNRFSRIFLPLLVAYILLSPLMRGAYEFAKAVVEFDSIGAGWVVFAAGDWIRWSKLYHLWFLLSLLLFTALATLGVYWIRRFELGRRLTTRAGLWLAGYPGMLRLSLLAAVTTVPSYIVETGSGTHWSMQVTLFGYFILGWFLYQRPDVIDSWRSRWRPPLLVALLALPVCVWASMTRLFDENSVDVAMGIVAGISNAIIGIAMTVALVGWFHLRLDRPTRIGERLGQASYWVYLIHFPIVVAAGGLLATLEAPAVAKYFLTLTIAVPVIALSYIVLVLGTPLKYVFGGQVRAR